MEHIKKIGLSIAVIFIFLLYAFHEKSEGSAAIARLNTARHSTASQQTSGVTPASSSSTPPSSGGYKDGSFTGSVADAFYGNIQVLATIRKGKISDVVFLQYPNDRRDSIEINTQAMPYLKQEAIQAQSAQVDIVSGATDSSQAFRESLTSALAKAR